MVVSRRRRPIASLSEGEGGLPPEMELISIGELIESQRKLAERRRKRKEAEEPPAVSVVRGEDPMAVLSSIEGQVSSFSPSQVKEALCR